MKVREDRLQNLIDATFAAYRAETFEQKIKLLEDLCGYTTTSMHVSPLGTDPENPPSPEDIQAIVLYDLEEEYLEKMGLQMRTYL